MVKQKGSSDLKLWLKSKSKIESLSRSELTLQHSLQKLRFKKKSYEKKNNNKMVVASRSVPSKFRSYTGEHLNWLQVIFRLGATVIPGIIPWVILCGAYSFLISVLNHFELLSLFNDRTKVIQHFVLSLNLVLSLLLAFRTNTAHERFWEGRKLWGSMVNAVRNLAREIWLFIEDQSPKDRRQKEAVLRLLVAFPMAMKLHLRQQPVNSELALLMSKMQYRKLQNVNHPPLEIAFWIGDYLEHQYDRQAIDVYQLVSLNEVLDKMVDILGDCERILKTPVPLIYTVTFNTLLLIYFVVLPLELVGGLSWATAPVVAFICLLFLSINEVGSEIEEPFGHDSNDLPLDFICATILNNVEDLIQFASKERYFCDWRTTDVNNSKLVNFVHKDLISFMISLAKGLRRRIALK